MEKNIWTQVGEVEALQEKFDQYLKLYGQYVCQSDEANEFLSYRDSERVQKDVDIIDNELQEQQGNDRQEQQISQYNSFRREKQQTKLVQDDIKFESRRINLSHIFQQITLGEEAKAVSSVSENLECRVIVDNRQVLLRLGQHDGYNLSNFSSFNNQKQSQAPLNYDFKDLLILIQQKVGKTLKKQGIQSIINQIEESAYFDQSALITSKEPLKQSDVTRYSLINSHLNLQEKAKHAKSFDIDLNHQPRQRNLKSVIVQEDKSSVKDIPQMVRDNPFRKSVNNKENIAKISQNKKEQFTKEIRIIKKNSNKSSLILVYTNQKQLQNFCISNKIYGKDKQKIIKALKQNKNIISLD